MAADTPTFVFPQSGELGIRLDERLIVLKSLYSGAGTQVEWQIQVSSDVTGAWAAADTVHDTLLRGTHPLINQNDWWVLWPSMWDGEKGAQAGEDYILRCRVRNSVPETSSWSGNFKITFETPDLTSATWAEAQ